MAQWLARPHLVRYLGIPLAVVLTVLAVHALGGLQRAEWMTYDARMSLLRAQATLHPDVEVILIDEASLQAMNSLVGRFPWPRSLYGDLLEFLAHGQPRAVVVDILFAEHQQPQEGAPGPHDQRLIEATSDFGPTYHAAQLIQDKPDKVNKQLLGKSLPEDFRRTFALPGASGFPASQHNNYLLPIEGLYQAAAGIGMVGLEPDADGVYRRVRLFRDYQGDIYPALAIAPLLPELAPDGKIERKAQALQIGDTRLPLTPDGATLVNLYSEYDPYSISGVFASIQALRAGEPQRMIIQPGEFKDKIVFVGASAVGLEDNKASPLAEKMPGVLIHAATTSNILADELLQPVSYATTVGITGLLALIIPWGLHMSRFSLQLAFPLALGLAYTAWTGWQFQHQAVWEVTPPLMAIALTWLATLAHLSFTEGKDKRRVRRMLAQYVSPAVLETVVDKYQDHLHAEVGHQEHITILFSDVRSFTTLSEQLRADQVVDLLNCHFSEMTDVIFRHQGTLDKFIGDAMMAFWGAPIYVPNHAQLAVSAATEMGRRLDTVNARLAEKGYPAIRIGVGLSTGDAILGNIGSEKKLDYTVIGDTVNLASRVEGLTGKYGCSVLLSEHSHQELDSNLPCGLVDLVRVKGKQVPIAIYRPLALPDDPPAVQDQARRIQALSQEAFELYRARRWPEAITAYQAMGDDPVAAIFLQRCRQYLAEPPPPDWEGILVLDSK